MIKDLDVLDLGPVWISAVTPPDRPAPEAFLVTVRGGTGAGRVVVVAPGGRAQLIIHVPRQEGTASLVVDLVVSVLTGPVPHAGTGRRVLWSRIVDFIDGRLADQALSPSVIAGAHNISVRYLHVLFREQGVTVTGWIRGKRLDRCRRDLRDPALAPQPVYAIGARWGFANATTFSRAFTRAYGMPPGDYRRYPR